METILVTGAFGFIGSNLTKHLLSQGYKVIAADLPYEMMSPLSKVRFDVFSKEFSEIELFDVRSLESCKTALLRNSPTIIVHLAALPGIRLSFDSPLDYWETNLVGSLNLIESAKSSNVRTVFLASSSSVYGSIYTGQKSKETDRIDLPVSPYAASKAAMEMMASTLAPSLNFKILSLRFFTVFGPFGRPDMAVWKFTKALMKGEKIKLNGDGSQLRDFTPISELVAKLEILLRQSTQDGFLADFNALNLGSGKPSSILELVHSLGNRLGVFPNLTFGDPVLGDVFETRSDATLQNSVGLTGKSSSSFSDGLDVWIKWALSNSDLLRSH